MATGAGDNTVILWDVCHAPWSVGTPQPGHSQAVSSLLFARDGESLFSGSLDGTIIRWDLEHMKPSATLIKDFGASVSSIFEGPESNLRSLALDKEQVHPPRRE